MQRPSTDAKIAALLAVAVALVFSDVLFLGNGFYIRDIYRDYLPSRFVLRTVLAGGEFPMWNRYWSAGQPLAANPGFQAFYPGTWLAFFRAFSSDSISRSSRTSRSRRSGCFYCCD